MVKPSSNSTPPLTARTQPAPHSPGTEHTSRTARTPHTARAPRAPRRGILWIEFFRTIWSSFGRFLAILAIIALGAGFFSGLKTAKPAMIATADKYLGEQNMYDLQLASTLGFSDDDLTTIADSSTVTQAQGVIDQDILGKVEGEHTDSTYAAHSLPDTISTLHLEAGRMARTASECVADYAVMGTDVVGKTITWSNTNSSNALDAMSQKSCTITGVATSPDYLNVERGASDLGDGKTYAFLYLPSSAFTSDIFTGIEVTVGAQGQAFSSEYKSSVAASRDDVKSAVTSVAAARYADLVATARDEMREKAVDQATESAQEQVEASFEAQAQQLQQSQGLSPTGTGSAGNTAGAQLAAAQSSSALGAQKQAAIDEAVTTATQEAEKKIADMSDADVAQKAGFSKPKTYVLTRSSNLGYASFENDTSVIEGIALIFPIFFLSVAAMVCLTTITKMIDEERGQIGLMKALGYRTAPVAAKYLGYSGLASLLGCVVGILIGTFLFPLAIWSGYGIIYKFAPITFVFDWVTALVITGGYLAVMAAVTWTVCWRELRSQPAELLRPLAPQPGKKIFLEHIGLVWNRLSFLHKVSLRNVFRFKKRLFMILAGVAGCTALIVACFGIRDSVSEIPTYQYGNVDLYSASVQLQKPGEGRTDADVRKDFLARYSDDLAAQSFVYENTADADIADTTKSVSVIAANDDADLTNVVNLHDGNDTLALPDEGNILISRGIAHTTGIGVGDDVTLRTLDGEQVSLTVSGVFDNYIALPVYINLADATQLWGSEASAGSGDAADSGDADDSGDSSETVATRTALVRFKDGVDEESVYAQMETDDDIQFTTPVSEDKDQLYTMMRALDAIVSLIILSAGALALIVLLNLTGINITERIREIATIKVLGFFQRETSAYVFRENIMLTFLGVIVGLPLGKLFHMFIMSQIKVDAMYMVPDIYWASYLYSALLTFAFLGVTFLVMYRRIAHIDMAGALKSPE